MQAAPTYRWGLGFIAMRWRHVFWLLPLLGMLLGLGLQFWKLYGPTATGSILVSPFPISSKSTRLADVIQVSQSDDILFKTVESLDLSTRWKSDPGACVAKLRESIHGKNIPGTSLVELRVSGSSRRETIEIWNMLFRNAKRHFADIEIAAKKAKLSAEDATIEALQRDLDDKLRKLSADLMAADHVPDIPGALTGKRKSAEIEQQKADCEAARKSLEKAKIDFLSPRMRCGCLDAYLNVHEEPVLPPLSLTQREILRPLLLQAGLGLSIGVILTAPFAYLLELLLPRRRLAAHFPAGLAADADDAPGI